MPDRLRFDLARLIRPIPLLQFFGEYWEKKPLLISRNDRNYYAGLMTLEQIDPLITVLPPDTVTVSDSDRSLQESDAVRADGSLDVVKACQLFAGGTTIVIDAAHTRLEPVTVLCRELEHDIAAPIRCNLYLTPPGGKGFDTHYDTHDVLLLQLHGSKEWTIFDAPVPLPLRNQTFDENVHPVGAPTMSFELNAGDFLYIPRGFLHHARSLNEVSLHATVGVHSYRWADVLLEAVADICLVDSELRRALPINLGRPDFDGEAARRVFADLLSRVTERASADRILGRLADEFVIGRRAIVPGQLTQALLAQCLVLTDQIGARPALIYQAHMSDDQVRIRAHGREIVFPSDIADAVTFALENERYRVQNIPGDLDDEDKITLAKRLIEEGLVRKLSAS